MMTGEWADIIDHIDMDVSNNVWENLRACSRSQNQWNSRSRIGSSRYKGVSFETRGGKWVAQICVHRKRHKLGYFATPEDAHAAYCEASARLHGEFGRVA